MTIWGLNTSYQSQFQPLFGGISNPFDFSMPSLFSFPRYNVFNNNIFGYTPPTNFCYMPQLDNMFAFMQPINLMQQWNAPVMPYIAPQRTSFDSNNFFNFTLNHTSSPSSRTYNTNTNLPALKDVGYNSKKAQKLANEIGKVSTEGGFDNYCARHVKEAIRDAGLGQYQSGHAYQMNNILKNNSNFKEISTKGLNLSSLPAGCILVYDRGASGYSSKYGHTEITLGNGTAGSGGITHNIRAGARVYVPV